MSSRSLLMKGDIATEAKLAGNDECTPSGITPIPCLPGIVPRRCASRRRPHFAVPVAAMKWGIPEGSASPEFR